MIIDNKGKLFGKISIIDILVVIVLLAGIAGVGYKFTKSKTPGIFVQSDKIETQFYVEETPDFSAKAIEIGAVVKDPARNAVFGKVKEVKVDKAVSFAPNSQGEMIKTSKPTYSSVTIIVEGNGVFSDIGVTFNNADYAINKWLELRVGNVGFWGRISSIKKKE